MTNSEVAGLFVGIKIEDTYPLNMGKSGKYSVTEFTTKIDSQWHSTTMNGMVEISHPVNLYKNCQGQPWQKVTVEFGFKAVLTVFAVNTLMDALIPSLSFVNMYAPWDVESQCAYLETNRSIFRQTLAQ